MSLGIISKFKKAITVLFIFIVLPAVAITAAFAESHPTSPSENIFRKDNFPWPWGMEIAFPWREAQGIYLIDLNGSPVTMVLSVMGTYDQSHPRPNDPSLFLNIELLDKATCQIIGTGRGFQKGNLIRAQFVSKVDQEAYVMSIHTFNADVVKMSGFYTNRKDMVMVASVGLLRKFPNADPRQMWNSAMVRLSYLEDNCHESGPP